jgi:hypothetical protein
MNGVLWVLRTGTCWMDLPDRFPSGSTCYRRFSHWVKTGALRLVLETLAQHLEQSKNIELSECFIDGTFVVAKKGGRCGKDQAGQGYKAHGGCGRCRSTTQCVHGFCFTS